MPKSTKTFQNMVDYKEAARGKAKGYVLFGHRPDLATYCEDIDVNQERSVYFGRILYPENLARKKIDGGEWDYEKNKAFWAGAIDFNQTFLLISDIEHYKHSGGTIDELFWLQDNGYQFFPYTENPKFTIAIPPENPLLSK